MAAAFWIIWGWVRSSGVSLLAAVPRQVWYVLAALLAMAYFHSWSKEQGRAEFRVELAEATRKERDRVQAEDRKTIEAAERRAVEAERLAEQRDRSVRDAIAAVKASEGSRVCLPADVTRRLRDIR